MNGRFLSIKKSTWLMISLVCNSIIFAGLFVLLLCLNKDYNAGFFFFCIGTGIHQIIRGALFKLDSSCYFGTLLFLVGGFYFTTIWFDIVWLYPVFVVVAFAFASIVVGVFYREPFQIFLAISLIFVSIGLLLFLLKIISIWIFVAIIAGCVLLLIVRFFTL